MDTIIPLLETLRSSGDVFVKSLEGTKSEARLHGALANQAGKPLATPEELASLFKSGSKFSTVKGRRFIRLRDTEDARRIMSPLIYLDGDLSEIHPSLRIQLLIVSYEKQANSGHQCLLLRFETPEGLNPAGQGKHDYYHSQLCTSFYIDGPNDTFSFEKCISWQALSCPAWPLDARTPAHLLACLVFALYGKTEGYRTLQQAFGRSVRGHIEDMHFVFEAPSLKKASKAVQRTIRKKNKSRADQRGR